VYFLRNAKSGRIDKDHDLALEDRSEVVGFESLLGSPLVSSFI
jgi:hypothetical protein